jgi:hypothetical protein
MQEEMLIKNAHSRVKERRRKKILRREKKVGS